LSGTLAEVNHILSFTDFQELYHAWGRKLVLPLLDKLGWTPKPDEKHSDTLLRGVALGRLVAFKEASVLQEAQRLFDLHKNGTALIPVDIRFAVYAAVALKGDEKTFNEMLKMYKEADTHEEKNRILVSLACTSSQSQLERLLSFAISDQVRSQDTIGVIVSISGNKEGRDLAWKFFQENFQLFRERYGRGLFNAASLVKGVTKIFASEEKAKEIESFFAKNPFPGTERNLQQALENVRLNGAWLSKDSSAIRDFLESALA